MPHVDSVFDLIENGNLDFDLDEIMEACRRRKHTVARMLFAQIKVGDTVRVIPGIKQKYLIGATGKVHAKRVTNLEVEWPHDMGDHDPYGKRAGRISVVPPHLIEKVEG